MEKNNLTLLARQLRKNQTKEEALLWYNCLRKYPLRFHRQYVIDRYIVDFYCHKARLVVELDGSQHFKEEEMRKDAQRTAHLEGKGLQVIRIPNNAVTENFREVCEYIDRIVRERM